MTRPAFRLYLITDRLGLRGRSLEEAIGQALDGGAEAVQLREKDLPVREICRLAERLRALTSRHGALLFLNDRADVAMAVGADGVHLTSRSLPLEGVRAAFGNRLLIGQSTHSADEVRRAEAGGADFVTFGPVFDTPSKRGMGKPLGIRALAEIVRQTDLPVFALGGVKLDTIDDVLATGCHGVAVISDVFGAENIRKRTEAYLERLSRQRSP